MALKTVLALDCDACHSDLERSAYCYKFGSRLVCFDCLSCLASWLFFLDMEEMAMQIINSRDDFEGGMSGIKCVAVHSLLDGVK